MCKMRVQSFYHRISRLNRWERIETIKLDGTPIKAPGISRLNRWERIETAFLPAINQLLSSISRLNRWERIET